MKIKYKTNFKGFVPVLRSIQLLLQDGTLNFTQLGAYISFVSQADFDSKHPHYTVLIRDDYELAKAWRCSPSTVNRRRNELIQKGLLSEVDGVTRVTNYSLFEYSMIKTYAKVEPQLLKTFFAITIDEVAKKVQSVAEMANRQPQNTPQSFNDPSKEDISFSTSQDNMVIDYDEVDKWIEGERLKKLKERQNY